MKIPKRGFSTFTIKRPFYTDRHGNHPLTIRVYKTQNDLQRRFALLAGLPVKLADCRGYFVEYRPKPDCHDFRREIGFCLDSLTPGTIAHESIHAVSNARLRGRLRRTPEGWEEVIARAVDDLTGIIWRHTERLRRKA